MCVRDEALTALRESGCNIDEHIDIERLISHEGFAKKIVSMNFTVGKMSSVSKVMEQHSRIFGELLKFSEGRKFGSFFYFRKIKLIKIATF
jgi:hypothetical protein